MGAISNSAAVLESKFASTRNAGNDKLLKNGPNYPLFLPRRAGYTHSAPVISGAHLFRPFPVSGLL
jgi:hypothetical protein